MARRVPVQILPGCRGRISVGELRRVAGYVLDAEDVAPAVAVEVVLADAATVRGLNRLYRGRDEPADVLSFATNDVGDVGEGFIAPEGSPPECPGFIEPPDATPSLGEVIVCLPVAEAQVAGGDWGVEGRGEGALLPINRGHTVAGEVVHLLVHGLLHLARYDHEDAAGASLMQAREDELLSGLGYAGAYEHGH